MKIRKTVSIIFSLLLFPVFLSAQNTVYYYGANGRVLESSEGARNSKSVKQVTGSCFRVKERMKTGEVWEITRKDRIRTGKDRIRTGKDQIRTGKDRIRTGKDRIRTGKDRIRTGKDQIRTGKDRIRTGKDQIRTGKDRIRTGKDGLQKIWRTEGTLFPKTFERNIEKVHEDLYYFEENKSGKLIREGFSKSLIPLHLEDKITEYHPGGKVKSESIYTDNRLVSNVNFNPDGSEYIHNIFYSVDQPPRYLFGASLFRDFFMAKIAEAGLPVNEINDEVVIGAVVMETGELAGIKVLKGKIPSVNSFFVETMELLPGKWEPARLDGKAVRYFIQIPFIFNNELSRFQFLEFSKDGQQLFWGL